MARCRASLTRRASSALRRWVISSQEPTNSAVRDAGIPDETQLLAQPPVRSVGTAKAVLAAGMPLAERPFDASPRYRPVIRMHLLAPEVAVRQESGRFVAEPLANVLAHVGNRMEALRPRC